MGTFIFVLFAAAAYTAWTIREAQKRGETGMQAAIAPMLWSIRPHDEELTDRSIDDYQCSDDALHAATQLDMQGKWDAAVALYLLAKERWPENQAYIEQCIKDIKKKQGA